MGRIEKKMQEAPQMNWSIAHTMFLHWDFWLIDSGLIHGLHS